MKKLIISSIILYSTIIIPPYTPYTSVTKPKVNFTQDQIILWNPSPVKKHLPVPTLPRILPLPDSHIYFPMHEGGAYGSDE
jgi:hypothetical protein